MNGHEIELRELESEHGTSPHCVYIARSVDDVALYVGMSCSLNSRLADHRLSAQWWQEANRIDILRVASREDAADQEALLTSALSPLHNQRNLRSRAAKVVESVYVGMGQDPASAHPVVDIPEPRKISESLSKTKTPRVRVSRARKQFDNDDKRLAAFFDITVEAIYNWKREGRVWLPEARAYQFARSYPAAVEKCAA